MTLCYNKYLFHPTFCKVLVRYNPDGSIDASFGTGGYYKMDFENDLLQPVKPLIERPSYLLN